MMHAPGVDPTPATRGGPPVFDRHARRRLAPVFVSLALALGIAACGAPATSVAPSQLATAAPSATAAPTPSPSAADVSAAFVKQLVSPTFSATATLSGDMAVGPVTGDIAGSAVFSGPNSSTKLTIKVGTFEQETEAIKVGGASWSRKSPGPWLEEPAKPAGSPGTTLGDIVRAIVSVEDLGLESRDGRQLHHLRSKDGNDIPASAFGVDESSAKDATFTLDFYATDDGTPAVMAIAGSWTQVTGATEVPTTMSFDIALDDVGEPQVINPPDDVWVRYTSDLGYTMAHPPDWTVASKKNQDTYLLNDQGYVYVAVTPYKGSTAKFASALKASYKKPFKGDPESEAATVLGGQPAVRLIYQYRNDEDQDVTIADDVVSRDGIGWEVFLATAGGPEDIDVFDTFVATFQFTD
jgi:hypothetical protein